MAGMGLRRTVSIAAVMLAAAACGSSVQTNDVTTTVVQASSLTTPTSLPATTMQPSTTTTQGSTTTQSTSTTSGPTATTTTLPPLESLAYEPVATGLSRPVFAITLPGDGRLLIMERGGRILIHDGESVLDEPFLDISDVVADTGIEMGLLGLGFHPEFEANGRFFVYYTDADEDNHLVEYNVGDDGLGDPTSASELLFLDEPTSRHNGGNMQFGPDGYLWITTGEGGDAARHAQDPGTLLSAILRLDVDDVPTGATYGIPPDNPFADGVGGAPEVWAYGLRNPWRWDIDPETDMIYIADVGHEEWEEIDAVSISGGGGHNFGWLIMEGPECFAISDCNPDDFTSPIHFYRQDFGCSITGGFVYRGTAIPELAGRFLYSDWCGGWLHSLLYVDGEVVEDLDWTDQVGIPGQITSFGEDASGELYVTTWEGDVWKLVAVRADG